MDLRKVNWWKAGLMLVLTVFFSYASFGTVRMLQHDYSNWIVSRMDVQERVYEATADVFGMGAVLLIEVSILIASLWSLILCFFPLKRPSVFARLAIRYRWRPALVCLIVLVLLIIGSTVLGNIIESTPEINEAPRTLRYRMISGWNGLAMIPTFEATIVMFFAWLQNMPDKKTNGLDESRRKL